MIQVITIEELKEKLDRGDDFKLVMTLGEWAFRAKHIPGSLHFPTIAETVKALDPDEEIIVYCSNVECPASVAAYHMLVQRGYRNVRRFAGGLQAWEEAGYPFEGEGLEEPG